MKTLTLQSPAKLNLYLRVLKKRPDDFHEIRTVFERIDLCDQVNFSTNRSGKISIACDHPQVPTGPKNLIHKAARLLQQEFGVSQGVSVRLKKNIPVAAGLAGGSSNAATTLMALNRLWDLKLSRYQLSELGNRLGSDISFFLTQCSWALGTGRGECIKKISISQKYWHILVTPKRKMSTPKVYHALDLKALTNKKDSVNILIHSLTKRDINNIRTALSNDLEQGILTIAPTLADVVQRMKVIGVKGVSFSGSGPTLFGLADSKQEAEYWCEKLRRRYSQVFAVSTR